MVTRIDNFIFTLNGKNGVAAVPFTPGPLITGGQCATSRRIVAVGGTAPIEIHTSTEHGFVTGDQVHIEGVLGRTIANNTVAVPFWTVTVMSPTQFSLDGTDATVAPLYVPNTGRVLGPRRVVAVPIQLVTQATPIVVTAIHHGFVTGDSVTVANVLGTTAANNNAANPNWTITVIDTNSLILNGTVGNAPFILGPRASGPSAGRNMGARTGFHRIAIEPAGAPPLMFVSRANRLLSSANGGSLFTPVAGTPWSAADERVTAIAAPGANQLWIATLVLTGAGTLRPSRVYFRGVVGAGPQHWFGAAENFVNDPGSLGIISAIAVDPNNPQQVAVVASGFSETHIRRRTRHCFVTTTGGQTAGATRAWTEVGGAFDAASGNLPDFPVLSVAWAPDADPAKPSTLLVASEGGVLRLNGNKWERVGPNLPNVSCQTLRVDSSVAGARPGHPGGNLRPQRVGVRPSDRPRPRGARATRLRRAPRRHGRPPADRPLQRGRRARPRRSYGHVRRFHFRSADSTGLRYSRRRKQTAQRPVPSERRRARRRHTPGRLERSRERPGSIACHRHRSDHR